MSSHACNFGCLLPGVVTPMSETPHPHPTSQDSLIMASAWPQAIMGASWDRLSSTVYPRVFMASFVMVMFLCV